MVTTEGNSNLGQNGHDSIVVMVTVSTEIEGATIAKTVIEEKLAACVKAFPVNSTYRWEGQTQIDSEWQLIIKTQRARFEALADRILSLHSYDTPEIVALPIEAGYRPYLSWIQQSTSLNK